MKSIAGIVIQAILMALALGGPVFSAGTSDFTIQQGYLDLRSWTPERDGIVVLEGEWAFYPGEFRPRGEAVRAENRYYMHCPGIWNGYRVNDKEFGRYGHATYSLIVDLPAKERYYAFKIPEMSTACRLFLDGEEMASAGTPGTNKEESNPAYIPLEIPFYSRQQRVHIMFHLSNYHHVKGGMWDPVLLGTPQQIRKHALFLQFCEIFLAGGLFLIGIYHIMLFWRRKSEWAALYLALFCFTIAARTMVVGEHLLVQAFPSMPWIVYLTVEYAMFPLAIIFCAFYLGEIFRETISIMLLRFLSALSLVYLLLVLFTPVEVFMPLLFYFQFVPVIGLLYIIPFIIHAIVIRTPYALIIGTGMLFFTLSFAYEFMYVNQIIFASGLISATSLGLIILVVCQAYVLSDRFSQALETTDILFRDMERQIETRTMELSNALSTMNENLEFAAVIQKALLPKQVPGSSRYKTAAVCVPAEVLAGDFFNFHVFRGGGLGVFIADVTGHGIASALIASMVNILFSTGRSEAGSPADFLRTMNNELTGNIENQFITACYAYLDESARKITCVRAGHEPVLVHVRGKNCVEKYQPRGMLMGYEKGVEYEEVSINLESGDRIFLYTDCIIEVRNGTGDEFGPEGLESIILGSADIPIEDIPPAVIAALEKWSGRKAPFHDDLTMVIIEIL